MTGIRNKVLVLGAALVCAGCAVSPEAEERREAVEAEIAAILSEPLDPEEYGTTKRCLAGHEYRSFRALDERRVLFEGLGGKRWLSTLPFRCPDLEYAPVLLVRSVPSTRRICEADPFVVSDWFSWPWYRRWPWDWGWGWGASSSCRLGKFQPVTGEQVDAIEAALQSR